MYQEARFLEFKNNGEGGEQSGDIPLLKKLLAEEKVKTHT